MKISLVIPCHNLEDYIEPLLCSLKYQVVDHDEVEPIFICDCCTDRTHEIIEDYLRETYTNMIILDREYHSSGLGRNDGIEMATGKYIWLLDGDDWLVDNYAITKVLNFFEAFRDEKAVHLGWMSNNYKHMTYLFTVWQWCFCSEWAKAVKFTSRQFDDDVEWVQKLNSKFGLEGTKKISDPLYFYNFMRPGSVMTERIKSKSE